MAKSNAERQRDYRQRKRKATQKCPHCGGWLRGEIATQIGFHQLCDRAGYMRRYREIKKSES